MRIHIPKDILNFFKSQNMTEYNDGTKIYSISSVIVEEKEGEYMIFSSYEDYISYLKNKK